MELGQSLAPNSRTFWLSTVGWHCAGKVLQTVVNDSPSSPFGFLSPGECAELRMTITEDLIFQEPTSDSPHSSSHQIVLSHHPGVPNLHPAGELIP